MISERQNRVVVRIINTGCKPIEIKESTILCDLEEVGEAAPSSGEKADGSHMDGIYERIDTSVSPEDRERLTRLLEQYSSVFSKGPSDMGLTDLVLHEIETGDNRPIRQALRPQPLTMLPVIDQHLSEMLEQKLIEPSRSEWASNVVMVKKKDGTLRFCVDYRKLNAATVKDVYPLPRIESCLDTLAGSCWFSTFDLRAGYHQVKLHPKDAHKTTFITRRGSFKFQVLPFGLCNAPATFERLMDLVMSGLNYEVLLVYLDDIIVFSTNLEAHFYRLEILFMRLAQAGLKLKPSKCHLLQREVAFLGHRVSGAGISTDPEKISAIESWPIPRNLREVRSFLGLCSYYRKYVQGFAETAEPLHALTRKGARFEWSKECECAFQQLKRKLQEAPVLTLPTSEDEFILDTDASESGLGAVLSKMVNGEEKPVAYASRLCSSAERNYNVTRRELLAVVYALKMFR